MDQKPNNLSQLPCTATKTWIGLLKAMEPTEQLARFEQKIQADLDSLAPISSDDLKLLFEMSTLRCLWSRVAESVQIRIVRQVNKLGRKRLYLRRQWAKTFQEKEHA